MGSRLQTAVLAGAFTQMLLGVGFFSRGPMGGGGTKERIVDIISVGLRLLSDRPLWMCNPCEFFTTAWALCGWVYKVSLRALQPHSSLDLKGRKVRPNQDGGIATHTHY